MTSNATTYRGSIRGLNKAINHGAKFTASQTGQNKSISARVYRAFEREWGAEDIPEYHPGPKVNGFEEGIRAGQNRDLVDFV